MGQAHTIKVFGELKIEPLRPGSAKSVAIQKKNKEENDAAMKVYEEKCK